MTGAPLKILSIENLYKTRQKKIKLGLRCLFELFFFNDILGDFDYAVDFPFAQVSTLVADSANSSFLG